MDQLLGLLGTGAAIWLFAHAVATVIMGTFLFYLIGAPLVIFVMYKTLSWMLDGEGSLDDETYPEI